MAKPYDPKLNPGKTLEETIENFIAWIRTSNRGTASVLRNISDKLLDISKTEENLKDLESSQIESLKQVNELLVKVSDLSSKDNTQKESTDSQQEIQHSLNAITSQLKQLDNQINTNKEETPLKDSFDAITSQLRQLADTISINQEEIQSEITSGMNRLEGDILDIKSDILAINSQLQIKHEKDETTPTSDKSIQQELAKIREQIICKTEQDKAKILQIIDDLISYLATGLIDISGLEIKKRLVFARSQVYEQTEGLAPRFRKMIDNQINLIRDETLYSSVNLELVLVEGLRFIREIYSSAPVGQHDM